MSFIDLDECLKQLRCGYGEEHFNSEIIQIQMDEEIDIKYRFLCKYCLQTECIKYSVMGASNVIKTIKEKYLSIQNQHSQQLSLERKFLIEIKHNINNLQSVLNQNLEEFNNLIDQLNIEFNDLIFNLNENFNLMDEIQEIIEKKNKSFDLIFDKFNHTLLSIKNSYQQKFENKVLKLQDQFSQIVKQLTQNNSRNKENEIQLIQNNIQRVSRIKIVNNINKNNTVKYTNINEKEYKCCYALAFDYQCKQLALCSKDNQVEIYNIENGIIQNKMSILQHEDIIFSIIYSKNQNWLATGNQNGSISIWKLQNSQWDQYTPPYKHNGSVLCLILNQKEDLLFTSSEDQTIIIWNLDIDKNKIDKRVQLNTKSGNIFSISLNQSENYLASCSRKDQIMIWENQEQNNQWICKQIIQLAEKCYGLRLGFYGDILIFQPQNIGICRIYEEKNKIFEEIQQLQLNNNESIDTIGLSPIQYNQIKDIMILKHQNYIYFIRKQMDQKFKIIGESIDYQNCLHFSSISQNGEYLAQWTRNQKIIQFKLDYE